MIAVTNIYCLSKSLSHVLLFATPWTIAHLAPLSMDFSWKTTGVGSHSILQGIFPTQGSNPGLLYCRQILYHLSTRVAPLIHITYAFTLHNNLWSLYNTGPILQRRRHSAVSCGWQCRTRFSPEVNHHAILLLKRASVPKMTQKSKEFSGPSKVLLF